MSRIVIVLKDQEGNPSGAMSLDRKDVLECAYNLIQHALVMTLSSHQSLGETTMEAFQNIKIESETIEGKKQLVKKQMPSFTYAPAYNDQARNNNFNVTDEEDMKRVWQWLHEDAPYALPIEDFFKMRADMIEKMQAARKEAEDRAKAEAGGDASLNSPDLAPAGAKLVNLHGEALTPDNV
jgi:hypothetical protein